jgi:NADP-dependent 3-hydroxy acid dehydrogenase YdfG
MSTGASGPAVAVVTGASRGIGFAVANALTQAGIQVVMLARGEQALRAAATRLGALAGALVCDVADAEAIEHAVVHIRERCGTPQIIVNNAGIFRLAPVDRTSVADFSEMLQVNLIAPFTLVRAFLPEMRACGTGHIVTIGSIADRVAFADNAAYAASKFGLRALHEVLRAELRGTRIRATLISPAAVDTPLWDPVNPDARPGFTPRSGMLAPEAVAAAVAYAVSQPASVNVDELRLSHS